MNNSYSPTTSGTTYLVDRFSSGRNGHLKNNSSALYSSVASAVRRLLPWQLIIFLLVAVSASASSVKCTNNASTDPQLVQTAVNAGGTVTLSGNCNFSSGGITIANAVSLSGSGNPVITGVATLVTVTANNVTINGIIFNQGVVYIAGFPTANLTFTNNTIENVSSQVFQSGVLHCEGLLNSNISYNTFYNNWFGGAWPTFPPGIGNGPGSGPSTIDNMGPAGLEVYNSATNTVFSHNKFNIVGNDALNLHNNGNNGTGPGGSVTITDNEFEHVFRANVEMQQGITNSVISGNYVHDATSPYWNSYAFSLASSGSNITFTNNTATTNNSGGICLPNALEAAGSPYLVQGNVFSTTYPLLGCNGGTWVGVSQGYPASASDTNTYQDNVLCGSPAITEITQEINPVYGAKILDQYNYKNTSGCSAGSNLTASSIAPVFTSPDDQYFPAGGNGTWNVAVVSNLSIRTVQFFVDSSASPVVTQSLQDVNTNFTNDLKWLYHATINTSTVGGGSHTMTAELTDVSGAVQKVSQPFTVGYVGTPVAQVSPTSLSFGSAPQGSKTAAEVVTLKNTGTASLVVNSIKITGADPADFGLVSSCGGSVASGSSCTLSITFTPSAVGARTASLSIADDAAGSPQSVSLSGTGTTAPSQQSVLNFSLSLNSWFWDAGQYYWSGNTHLLVYPTYTPNPDQDFQFTSVAGVTNGWTICIMGTSVCLTDSGSAGTGGFVTLGAKADTWVATAGNTLQNLRTKNFLAYPAGTVGNGSALVTGTAQTAWVFGPTH